LLGFWIKWSIPKGDSSYNLINNVNVLDEVDYHLSHGKFDFSFGENTMYWELMDSSDPDNKELCEVVYLDNNNFTENFAEYYI